VEEAMPLLTERVQLDPGNAVNYYDLGQGLARKGQPNDASVQFQEALRLRPEYADAHVGLGLALMDLGKIEQAKAHFSEALRIEPESEAASRNLRRAVSALESSGR
jgi:tetratricopeptide (TPR) repeat protein